MNNRKHKRFVVGFFSAKTLGFSHVWRPREEDAEECGPEEAERRYQTLRRSMLASELVDGLPVCSVYEKDARTGEVTRSACVDGHESIADDAGSKHAVEILGAIAGARGDGRISAGMAGRRALPS